MITHFAALYLQLRPQLKEGLAFAGNAAAS
jgi:hypothetical protein